MILPYSFYCVVCLIYVFAKNDKKLSVFDVKTTIPLGLTLSPKKLKKTTIILYFYHLKSLATI